MFSIESVQQFVSEKSKQLSADMIGWLAVLFMHGATIPPILGLLMGISDRMPSIDVVIFLWTGLVLLFLKALINKDMLNIITIGVGFIIQACLLGFLVFR